MLIIGGATATGKSDLAIALAKKFNGEIISADSMQIYKSMDIGTAKLKNTEMEGIKHHLIDVVEPSQSFSVADFVALAKPVIENIKMQGKLPVIVGGTGLYINALLYDYHLSSSNNGLRNILNKELEEKGSDYMYQKLIDTDSIAAQNIHKNNTKRVIRALEVYLTTNKSIFDKTDKQKTVPHLMYAIECDREFLYNRINLRVEKMFDAGLVKEVKALVDSGISFTCQSMQAIGYKEFKEYFDGVKSLEETKNLIKQYSRNYAKRQLTWFKRIESCKWLEFDNIEIYVDIISKDITESKLI